MSLPTPTFSRREDVGSELGSPPVDPASLDIRLTSPFLNRSSGNGVYSTGFKEKVDRRKKKRRGRGRKKRVREREERDDIMILEEALLMLVYRFADVMC